MSLIVEIGAGLANADSYVSVETVQNYAAAQGLTFDITNTGAEPACRRATQFIDTYRSRFSGYRTFRRAQSREWPRTGAYYTAHASGINGYQPNTYSPYPYFPDWDYIAPNQIPVEIVAATCEAAIRELADPGTMLPDLERGGALKRRSAGGSTEEYSASASVRTSFLTIENILSDLVVKGSFGIAVRG